MSNKNKHIPEYEKHFEHNARYMLRILKNIIVANQYKTRGQIIHLIDTLIDEPKKNEKIDWDAVISMSNAQQIKLNNH